MLQDAFTSTVILLNFTQCQRGHFASWNATATALLCVYHATRAFVLCGQLAQFERHEQWEADRKPRLMLRGVGYIVELLTRLSTEQYSKAKEMGKRCTCCVVVALSYSTMADIYYGPIFAHLFFPRRRQKSEAGVTISKHSCLLILSY